MLGPTVAILFAVGVVSSTALATEDYYATVANLIDRVDRLEKRLSGPVLTEMMGQSEQLRSDLRLLRGDMEQLSHDIEELKQQQREQYLDLDRRIKALSGGAVPAGKPAANAAAASEPRPPSEPSADAETVRQAYRSAFNSLKEGRYKEAIELFKGFLSSYPSGDNADNAQYWLGESYYVTRDFNAARAAFNKLVDAYPKSTKAADALLRLGYIEYDSQKWVAASQILTDVGKRYPSTNAAQQAQARLQQMKQEGH